MAANEYINHLYSEDLEGYIQIMQFDNGQVVKIYNTQYKGIRDIVQEQQGEKDTFISPNSFYIPERANENIRHYRALYIDLDLEVYSKTEAIYEITMLVDKGTIPEPTMVVDSGRGLHCYWRIEHAPKGAAYTWQELEDYLYRQLKYLGADLGATDSSRVLRLPNTINSRNNGICKVISINNNRYSMYELREKYLHYRGKKQKQHQKKDKQQDKGKVKHYFNSYTLHIARAEDLETLCRLRDYKVVGYRNKLLHCYIYWKGIYVRDDAELQEIADRFNNNFNTPLKDTEVKATVKSTKKAIEKFIDYEQGLRSGENKRVSKGMREHGGYWYTNETLINMLDITEDEQKHLKTIIGTNEKYRRNNIRRRKERRNEAGLTMREQQKKDNIKAVKELAAKGLNQSEIAKEVGLHQSNVSRILNNKY